MRKTSITKAAMVVPALMVAGLVAGLAMSWSGPLGASQDHTASGAIADKACPDEKAGLPASACWLPPAGYVPASKAGVTFTPIAVPNDVSIAVPAGKITTKISPPFPASEFLTTDDAWWDSANGVAYRVFAGSVGHDASQGTVVIFSGPASDPSVTGNYSLQSFPTSAQDGSLTITGSNGWMLTLQAADGAVYRFNVATQSYQ